MISQRMSSGPAKACIAAAITIAAALLTGTAMGADSTDDGASQSKFGDPGTSLAEETLTLEVDPANPAVLYVGKQPTGGLRELKMRIKSPPGTRDLALVSDPAGRVTFWSPTSAITTKSVGNSVVSVWVRGESVGQATIRITYTDPVTYVPTLLKEVPVVVVAVDIDGDLNHDTTYSEDDPEEHTAPGLFVGVNDDDDGAPAGPDNLNTLIDTATDKADMVVLKLRQLQPAVLSSGTVTLSVSDRSKLRVFDQSDTARIGPFPGPDTGSYEVPLGDISGGDLDFLAEGVSLGEATLSLVYRDTSGNAVSRDDIKVTVMRVGLGIANGGSDLDNGENAGTSPGTPLAEDQKGDPTGPGAYLLVNWDDDNGAPTNFSTDPIPDLAEGNEYVGYHAVLGEDNLARLFPALDTGGGTIPSTGIVALGCPQEDTKVRFFTEPVKGTRLQFFASSGTRKHCWDLQDSAQRVEFSSAVANGIWMEGVDASSAERDIEVKLTYGLGGGDIGSDTVKATVVLIRLGDAVYRENMLGWSVYPLRERCHTGLVYAFDGPVTHDDVSNPDRYSIVQMSGLDPSAEKLEGISKVTGFEYWYCYTNTAEIQDNVAGHVKRLKILKVAYWAWHDWSRNYCAFDCMDPIGSGWDGTLADVGELRCDGLVELAYEFNGIMVWGKIVGGTAHYDMRNNAYLDEHNEWQWGDDPEDWDWDMYGACLPVTQGGFADQYISEHDPSYSGPAFRGNLWQTTFQEQRLTVPSALSPESHTH
jgi:hypothetical protein